jgi:AP endonuclease-2
MNLPPNPENPDEPPDPPRFATRFWDEFSGKQRSLKDFFGGGPNKAGKQIQKRKDRTEEIPLASTETAEEDAGQGESQGPVTETKQFIAEPETEAIIDLTNSTENSPVKPKRKTSTTSASTAKKKIKQTPRADPSPSQTNLATFFRPPQSTSSRIVKVSQPSVTPTRTRSPTATTSRSPLPTTPEQDSDYLFAKALASAEEYVEQDGEDGDVSLDQSQAVASWSSIFAKKIAPRCRIHNLPCKAFGKLHRSGAWGSA